MSHLNLLTINSYIHCGLCTQEFLDGKHKGESPKSIQRIQLGWTKEGLQVWCTRHNCNIMHMDFEGRKIHADTTRQAMDKELV